MRAALLLIPALAAACAVDPPAEVAATGCGIGESAAPPFSLLDLNPNSPTYNTAISNSDHLGEVMVIYWAVST